MNVRALLARPLLGFDLLRVYLGIGLTVRGALIASDPTLIEQFLLDNDSWFVPLLAAHGIVAAHVVGGMLLALGCGTRLAAAVQIPPVAGALFLLHWHEGLFTRAQSFEFAALVLVALILYAIFGAGTFSVDWVIAQARSRAATSEPRPALLADLDWQPQPQPAGVPAGALSASIDEMPMGSVSSSREGEARDAGLQPQQETPWVRRLYRDVKLELMLVVTMLCGLFTLLASGLYVAATAWLIVSVIMFGVWRIGRAPFR